MFKLCNQTSIHIKSQQIINNSNFSNSSTQTESIKSLDKEIQSLTVRDKSVQVNLDRNLKCGKTYFDLTKLKEFINYASNLTIKEINESIAIAENLKKIEQINRENEEFTCDFHYISRNSKSLAFDQAENESSKLTIEHVIWSSNLNQIILGFSVNEHICWCTHTSKVEFCNLYQTSNTKPNKLKKIFEVKVKYCITQMVNNPTQFSQIAIGTKAGTIEIIDREFKESSIIKNESNLHKLEITYLSFKKNSLNLSSNSTPLYDELLSCSLDGQIILWKLKQFDKLQPIKVFCLSKRSIKQSELLGIKKACLFYEGDHLLIGCENNLFSTCINTKKFNELDLDFKYESHKGEIESIEQCPSNRNLFLSNGKDGEIRLYEMNLKRPLLTIYFNNNELNYKWVELMDSSSQLNSYFIVGLQNNNLHLINLFKKDENFFTTNLSYALKDSFNKLFISRSNQLALVLGNEVSLFDLNVLM